MACDAMNRNALLLIAALACFSACERPRAAANLDVSPQFRSGTLVVEGTTNLPDGALIAFQVKHEAGDRDQASEPGRTGLVEHEIISFVKGFATVRAGKYASVADVSNWKPGRVEVRVVFQTIFGDRKQPHEVIERFGEKGERLAGQNVVSAGRGVPGQSPINRLEVVRTFVLGDK